MEGRGEGGRGEQHQQQQEEKEKEKEGGMRQNQSGDPIIKITRSVKCWRLKYKLARYVPDALGSKIAIV